MSEQRVYQRLQFWRPGKANGDSRAAASSIGKETVWRAGRVNAPVEEGERGVSTPRWKKQPGG
jgi:hypothetical protein